MITPFRRHTSACLNGANGKPGLAAKRLTPERLRGYEHCSCPCYFKGTWNGTTYPRTGLNLNDWKAAERACQEMMKSSDVALRSPQAAKRWTVAEALELWHEAGKLPPKLAASTMDTHRAMGVQFLAFLDRKNVEPYLDSITSFLITTWRAEWADCAETTQRTRLSNFGAFLRFCTSKSSPPLMLANPMDAIRKPPAKPVTKEDTEPIDPDGGTRNYESVLRSLARPRPRVTRWTSKLATIDLNISVEHKLLLTQLQYESGLRVSDAFAFDIRGVTVGDHCAVYEFLPIKTRRTGRTCQTVMPLWLASKLKATVAASGRLKPRPFCPITSAVRDLTEADMKDLNALKNALWRAYQDAGIEAGVAGVHAHRFRNSFAVRMLNEGVRIETVSKWLGHKDIKTTQSYYTPWVKSRSDAAQREYVAAFGGALAITG